jgi:hypothetical protein
MWYEFIFPICDFKKNITSDSETKLDLLRISMKKPFFLGRNTFLLVLLLFYMNSEMYEKNKHVRNGTDFTPHFGDNLLEILWVLAILRKSVFSLNLLKRVP